MGVVVPISLFSISRSHLVGVVIAGFVLLGCASGSTTSSQMPVTVDIVDGDTIIVDFAGSHEAVRLLGIDTPETVDPNRPVQCFGKEATDFLSSLIPPGTPVRVERDHEARDRFGRLLLYVYRVEDDLFINEELLRGGYADIALYAPNETHRARLQGALNAARTTHVGLWESCGGPDVPIDPPPISTVSN